MDNLPPHIRRKNMQNVRSANTKPELIVFRELRRKKIYFAKHVRSLPGKPDIVFRRKKIAVFVDSDFWHGHPKRYIRPKSNQKYWDKKITNNILRDKIVNKELKSLGWKVLRVWEYDVKKSTGRVINKILRVIESR